MFVVSLSFWFLFWFCVGVVLSGSFRHAVLMRWSYIRKTRRARRVIRQNIWEQCPRHALCLGWRISTCVLQSVREGSKETPIGRRFTPEVGTSFLDKYHRLRGPGSAFDLTPATTIIWRQRAGPQTNFFCPQSGVR